jgi:hypothetical protein
MNYALAHSYVHTRIVSLADFLLSVKASLYRMLFFFSPLQGDSPHFGAVSWASHAFGMTSNPNLKTWCVTACFLQCCLSSWRLLLTFVSRRNSQFIFPISFRRCHCGLPSLDGKPLPLAPRFVRSHRRKMSTSARFVNVYIDDMKAVYTKRNKLKVRVAM